MQRRFQETAILPPPDRLRSSLSGVGNTAVWVQGHFPEAEKDPVIQIASMVTVQGESKPAVRNIMTLKKCAPIVGAEVMSFDNETGLLRVTPPPSLGGIERIGLEVDIVWMLGFQIAELTCPKCAMEVGWQNSLFAPWKKLWATNDFHLWS